MYVSWSKLWRLVFGSRFKFSRKQLPKIRARDHSGSEWCPKFLFPISKYTRTNIIFTLSLCTRSMWYYYDLLLVTCDCDRSLYFARRGSKFWTRNIYVELHALRFGCAVVEKKKTFWPKKILISQFANDTHPHLPTSRVFAWTILTRPWLLQIFTQLTKLDTDDCTKSVVRIDGVLERRKK